MFEPHSAAIGNAGMRVDRPDETSKHVAVDRQRPRRGGQLQMDAAAGPEWAAPLNQGAAGAEIDERDGMAGTHRRSRQMEQRRQEPRVVPAVG
jgi:hypothetical protein